MSVTHIVLRQRKGKETLTGGKRVRTFQAIYHVKCNSINEDPNTILAHPSLPTLAPVSTWPTDAGSLLVDRDPQQDMDRPDHWVVTLSYTSSPDIRKPDDVAENPLLRPAVIERSPCQRQRIFTVDVDNNLIKNTAGDLFNPPPEREEHAPSLTITKNMLNWPYAAELAFTDAINVNPITYVSRGIGYGARLVKCNGFSGKESYENGFNFWAVSVALEVNWDGWNKDKLNCGFNEKIDVAPFFRHIKDAGGAEVTEPKMLDSLGHYDPASTLSIPCKSYREVAFADLFTILGIT